MVEPLTNGITHEVTRKSTQVDYCEIKTCFCGGTDSYT